MSRPRVLAVIPKYRMAALFLIFCLLILPELATAQVYRWVDENGVTQFSDSPPGRDGKPQEVPDGNSALPMRHNNATLRRKLPDPEPRYRPQNNSTQQIEAERRIAREKQRQEERCEKYVRRIEWINDRLGAGGYSIGYGNDLRAERRELSSKRAFECLFKN